MKIKLFLAATMTLTVSFLHAVNGQINLVPNPSFEDTVHCPNSLTQINYANGWSSYSITPDYFNSCASSTAIPSLSVPSNLAGYQFAKTGNAYAGLVTFYLTFPGAREYIGIELNQPLDSGVKYFASFFISRAVSSNPYVNIATNKMGMRMSTVSFSSANPSPVNNLAHVYSDSIITDTLNWVKISGTFVADSAYNYLAIGNFFNDSLTSKIFYDTTSSVVAAYYFVDDVFLIADSLTGIFLNDKNKIINIFPNAAQDWITIEGKAIHSIQLIDMVGNTCLTFYPTSNSFQTTLNVKQFSRGIYILKINNAILKKIILN